LSWGLGGASRLLWAVRWPSGVVLWWGLGGGWVECGDAGEDQGDAREEFGLVVVVA